jgi:transposase
VIHVEDWAEIRRMHRVEGMSARAVARQLGISRNTVLRALASDRPPQYRRAPKGSAVDAVEPAVRDSPRQGSPRRGRAGADCQVRSSC